MPTPAEETLPELLSGLQNSRSSVRVRSARELGKLRHPPREALSTLVATTDDPEQAVREAAVQAVGAFGQQALPVLIQLLGHGCKYVRRNAVWAITKLGPEATPALPALCNALKDVDPRTGGGAAQAIGAIGPAAADAIPALAETMRGTNVVLCRLASKALSQIGPAALPTLVTHLKHYDPFVRGEAAVALGWMGRGAVAAVPSLVQLLTARATPAGPSRISKFGGSGAVTPVAIAQPEASAAEETTLIQVIQALGRIGGSADAEPLLLDLLTDKRESVRQAAADALRQIREE